MSLGPFAGLLVFVLLLISASLILFDGTLLYSMGVRLPTITYSEIQEAVWISMVPYTACFIAVVLRWWRPWGRRGDA